VRTYRAGAEIIPFRAVRFAGDGLMGTVIAIYPPSKPDRRALGIAQTGEYTPGRFVSVADEPGELCQAEAGDRVDSGAWLTTDEMGRMIVASPGRTPVIAIARGRATAAGDMIAVEIAPPGLTT
jgi:hypothetical protein